MTIQDANAAELGKDITKANMVTPEVLSCPYHYYQRVRDEAPVHQTPLGFYAVSRYEDIMSMARDYETFSSQSIRNSAYSEMPAEAIEIAKRDYKRVDTLLTNDPPSHTQFRSLVNKAFLPKRVAQLEESIREITNDLIDRFIDDGKVDLVAQFAIWVPLTVIADALGVDRKDMPKFKKWSDDSVAPLSGLLSPERQVECAQSRYDLHMYMAECVRQRDRDHRRPAVRLELGGERREVRGRRAGVDDERAVGAADRPQHRSVGALVGGEADAHVGQHLGQAPVGMTQVGARDAGRRGHGRRLEPHLQRDVERWWHKGAATRQCDGTAHHNHQHAVTGECRRPVTGGVGA